MRMILKKKQITIIDSRLLLNTNQNLTKERRTKIINKKLWIKVEISINERTTLKFRMINVNFKGKREKREKEKKSCRRHTII